MLQSIWLIKRKASYDQYEGAVVAALTEEIAIQTLKHAAGEWALNNAKVWGDPAFSDVTISSVGETAIYKGVTIILTAFNAG